MNWDEWVFKDEKSVPNDAGIYLYRMTAEIRRQLSPSGNSYQMISECYPVGPEKDTKELFKNFMERVR